MRYCVTRMHVGAIRKHICESIGGKHYIDGPRGRALSSYSPLYTFSIKFVSTPGPPPSIPLDVELHFHRYKLHIARITSLHFGCSYRTRAFYDVYETRVKSVSAEMCAVSRYLSNFIAGKPARGVPRTPFKKRD